jgi:hypothetical protein
MYFNATDDSVVPSFAKCICRLYENNKKNYEVVSSSASCVCAVFIHGREKVSWTLEDKGKLRSKISKICQSVATDTVFVAER